jgi:hypothetical protein
MWFCDGLSSGAGIRSYLVSAAGAHFKARLLNFTHRRMAAVGYAA